MRFACAGTQTIAANATKQNLNPRPSDVTDKKGTGTPNNPTWDSTTALDWNG